MISWARKLRIASRTLFEDILFGFAPENNIGFTNLDNRRLITSYVHSLAFHADRMFIELWEHTMLPMGETTEQAFESYVKAAQSHNDGRQDILSADGTEAQADPALELLRPDDPSSRPLTKIQIKEMKQSVNFQHIKGQCQIVQRNVQGLRRITQKVLHLAPARKRYVRADTWDGKYNRGPSNLAPEYQKYVYFSINTCIIS